MPLTKSWADLGFSGMPEQPALPSGESLFTRLPADQQRQIMGDASYRAWKAGAVNLQDFVGGIGRYAALSVSPQYFGPANQEGTVERLLCDPLHVPGDASYTSTLCNRVDEKRVNRTPYIYSERLE